MPDSKVEVKAVPVYVEEALCKWFSEAPCFLCGYNGEGYYQPNAHSCAKHYHSMTLSKLWNTRPIANNGVSFEDIEKIIWKHCTPLYEEDIQGHTHTLKGNELAKAICAKFTAPEAKQREVKWPEKKYWVGKVQQKQTTHLKYRKGWNEAIDACKKAYEEAQPSSPVNAELRSALEECISVMLENDEYGWSDDAIKQAEQALNSIKSGKDTKCS